MSTPELHGKTALITGASRGIGKQIAIELGRRGADVVVAARTVQARTRLPGTIGETVEQIEAVGANALAVPADMARPDDLDRLVNAAIDRFGHVDILINNAAATAGKSWGLPLVELTREEWMAQFDVNLHAPYTLIRAVVPIMQTQGGGRIINLTTAGHRGDEDPAPGLTVPLAYPASKAALDQFCISVAAQLRPLGVSIVNLHPGFVRTEMVDIMEAGGLDAREAIPIDVPTRALAHLATCAHPMEYTGQILTAETLVRALDESSS
jgi:NAD(P)-dependent dehydrogenase (short-subunit alcohol dehydrogenase family)